MGTNEWILLWLIVGYISCVLTFRMAEQDYGNRVRVKHLVLILPCATFGPFALVGLVCVYLFLHQRRIVDWIWRILDREVL